MRWTLPAATAVLSLDYYIFLIFFTLCFQQHKSIVCRRVVKLPNTFPKSRKCMYSLSVCLLHCYSQASSAVRAQQLGKPLACCRLAFGAKTSVSTSTLQCCVSLRWRRLCHHFCALFIVFTTQKLCFACFVTALSVLSLV